ncbi:MAG: hypothetical protein ACTSU5_01505 [Promethearchaeota archaeon]
MSVRWQKFVARVARDSEFKPISNRLRDCLINEVTRKYVQYPRFKEKMEAAWKKIDNQSELAQLLFRNYEYAFRTWLTEILPYRRAALSLENPEAPTAVDFKLDFRYEYNEAEIKALERAIKAAKLEIEAGSVVKRLLIFSVSAMGPTIADIVKKPFSFQIFSVDSKPEGKGITVETIMSAREQ